MRHSQSNLGRVDRNARIAQQKESRDLEASALSPGSKLGDREISVEQIENPLRDRSSGPLRRPPSHVSGRQENGIETKRCRNSREFLPFGKRASERCFASLTFLVWPLWAIGRPNPSPIPNGFKQLKTRDLFYFVLYSQDQPHSSQCLAWRRWFSRNTGDGDWDCFFSHAVSLLQDVEGEK